MRELKKFGEFINENQEDPYKKEYPIAKKFAKQQGGELGSIGVKDGIISIAVDFGHNKPEKHFKIDLHGKEINEAVSIDIVVATKEISKFNKKVYPYNGDADVEDLAEVIIKHLGYKATKDNVESVADHLEACIDDNDKIPVDKDIIKEIYPLLENVNEGVGKGHPDITKVMTIIEEFDGDMMETLLTDIASIYSNNIEELNNMDAKGIAKHIMEAVKLLKKRTGN